MIIRRCVPESEQSRILYECHASPYGGHFARDKQPKKFSNQVFTLQKKSKLETDNSVSNPSGNGIPDGLETEFSVFKTLISNCVRLNSVSN